MKGYKSQLLLHPVFLICLLLLLVNDFAWKYQYPNWFTGKLSDFAGLVIFPVLFSAFFNKYKKIIFIITGFLFLWWKSPLSEPVINFLNGFLNIPVHRIVDYTDYSALLVLPLAYGLKAIHYKPTLLRSLAICSVAIVSFFSFTATTLARYLADDNHNIYIDETLRIKKTENEIITALQDNGIPITNVPELYEPVWGSYYFLGLKDRAGVYKMVSIDSLKAQIFKEIRYGSFYHVPKIIIEGDTILNLKLIINDYGEGKSEIQIKSFQYSKKDSQPYLTRSSVNHKTVKPLKKKLRQLLNR